MRASPDHALKAHPALTITPDVSRRIPEEVRMASMYSPDGGKGTELRTDIKKNLSADFESAFRPCTDSSRRHIVQHPYGAGLYVLPQVVGIIALQVQI